MTDKLQEEFNSVWFLLNTVRITKSRMRCKQVTCTARYNIHTEFLSENPRERIGEKNTEMGIMSHPACIGCFIQSVLHFNECQNNIF
jgi:hypothetical protein